MDNIDSFLPEGDLSGIILMDCKWAVKTAGPSPYNNERTELFFMGCKKALSGNPCKGCFNSQTWDSSKAMYSHDPVKMAEHINNCAPNKYITIGGGEPFDQKDNYLLIELCKAAHTIGKDVWVWSGYTFEELKKDDKKLELLQECDILVDGPFIDEQKDLSLKWRGSTNQRVINIKESLASGKVVEYR